MTWRRSYHTEVTLDCVLPELWFFVSFSLLSTEVLFSAFTTYWHFKRRGTLDLRPFIIFHTPTICGQMYRSIRKRTFGQVRPSKIQISAFAQCDQNLHWAHLDSQGCKGSLCAELRLWSICADVPSSLYVYNSTVILSLPLIQKGQLSVSGERMCTIPVNRLED